MSYQALARRWRPRQFVDVVGQDHVVKALTTALNQGRVHHAFLFTGTRGVGKTTLARLLAKALNCEVGVSASPCDQCSNCQGVTEGRFIDLIEVDAASRTRVDDTREILDNVQYTPTHGIYKVYIIDEVHMLSTHSFNALLKTLEEPPTHVKFLLATTDPHKLPATILSRCLQFNLRALDIEEIAHNLKKILDAEGIVYEDSGLMTLSRVASGSMRDGLSLLDQAIAFSDGTITNDHVRDMLGMIEHEHVVNLLDALANEDATTLVQLIKKMEERSIEYLTALDELLLVLHDISLYHVERSALEAKGIDIEMIKELGRKISVEDAQLFYQIGLYGKRDLPFAPTPSSGFEMALLRMLAFRPIPHDNSAGTESRTQVSSADRKSKMLRNTEEDRNKVSVHRLKLDQYRDLANPDVWAKLVQETNLEGISRELAMNMAPIEYEDSVLLVVVDASVADLYNKERQVVIEHAVSTTTGQPVTLKLDESVKEASGTETPVVNHRRHMEAAKTQAYQNLITDPMVKDVIDTFGATVVSESVKPGNKGG